MNKPMILKDISYSFGNKKVLENLNLNIAKGSFHSLVGVTGAGKSLTLKLIASLVPLVSGEITGLPLNISYAFQQSPLIPWLNVKENLKICTTNYQDLSEYLKYFHLEELSSSYPAELSGGMIQKINIIRCFLGKPDLILMDEPFVHIDSIQREGLHNFLIELWNKFHPTIVFVTHDIDEAIFLSQKISLYSKKDKCIVETFNIAENNVSNLLELKKSPQYHIYYKKIYDHLKQDLAL
ncbi:MAG: ATP-binding cassette domain-containing protein [Bacteriovorax sp.]|nr:ATP-binding cassette domain-containing protein [Bacteriovorax sp.]